MKSRILLLTLMMLLLCISVKAQEIIECAATIPPGVTVQQSQSGNLNLYKRTTFTEPLRLAVHIVRYSDGSGGISQSNLEQKINDLNSFMSQALLQFFVYKIDYIDNDYFAIINDMNKANQLRTINVIDNCINVYFVPQANFNGTSSFSPRIQDPNLWAEQGIIIRNSAPPTTLPHEMGHYFDLFHTPEVYFGFENIARTGSCVNWNYTGDLLGDTPADPSYRVTFPTINPEDCSWITPPRKPLPPDGCGQTNYNPLTNNMMDTQVPQCRTTFTENQKDRMNETLMLYRSELLKPLVYLENSANSSNAGGTLHIGNNNYNSGKYVVVDEGTYNIGTNNERFANFQGSGFTYKHNNWNELSDDFFLSRNIEIIADNDQIGKFNKLELSKIKVLLDGNLLAGVGAGSFQDPWYVLSNGSQPGNHWINFTSEYEPTGKEGAQEKGVFLNQNPTFDPTLPIYSVKAEAMQDIYLSQTGRTHKFYFQGWSATPQGSAEFQNVNALQTPVVFKQAGATVQANYKGTQISSSTDGFKNAGQRKLIITSYPQAHYHLVYTSMGGVWYEKAQVNYDVLSPVNWQLMNNQKALNNLPSQEAKSPSIDFVYHSHELNEENYNVYIVYQNKKSDGKYEIRLAKFNQSGTKIFDISVYQSSVVDYNSVDCTPVVAVSKQITPGYPIKLVILWKRPAEGSSTAGLYYVSGFDAGTSVSWTDSYPNPMKIPSTDANSYNPTIAVFKKPNDAIYYHLAYQQGTSEIKYSYIAFGVNGTSPQNPVTISAGSGSYTNISPSITVSNSSANGLVNYDSPKIVWNADGSVIYRYRTNMTTTKWSPMYIYIENDEAQSPSISGPKFHPNGIDDEFYFGWSWLEGYYKSYVSTENLSQKRPMGYKGKDLQLATVGEGWEGFGYVVLDNFTRTSAPIVFENKWIDVPLSKITSNISAGRSGTVIKGDAEFYFAFGDIKLNANTITFNELNDTTVIESVSDLNANLKSTSISVTDNDILTYSVFYGIKDSAAAFNSLTNEDYIKFTVEIIDANTSEVLSSLDAVEQRRNSLIEYENLEYQISMQGIGQREIILQLKVQSNLNSSCELANIYSFNLAVSKGRIKQIKWNDENLPKEYALEQNYPNPFNPTTVINFVIPSEARNLVTLKVYDVLGNEVATLVDEYKEAGRYKVEFDASRLASGVYIYKLTAGSFVSSKKMMVIK